MRVGITATRRGLTVHQRAEIRNFLWVTFTSDGLELHHGMCIGGDLQVHNIARELFGDRVKIHGHPGTIEKYRAQCDCDVYYQPKYPTTRNRDIVYSVDWLVALPGENEEVLRSGTWMTIRYARKKSKLRTIIYPDADSDITT